MKKSFALVLMVCLFLTAFSACRQTNGNIAASSAASAFPTLPSGTQSYPVFTSSDWGKNNIPDEVVVTLKEGYTLDKYPKLKTLLMDNNIGKIDYSNMVPDIVFLKLKVKNKDIAIEEINRLRSLPEVKDAVPEVMASNC